MRRAATARLAWALLLTPATIVAIFVLDPIAGRTESYDPQPEADGPWYARFGKWLGMLADREFPRPPTTSIIERQSELIPVGLTLSTTFTTFLLILLTTVILTIRFGERTRPSRAGTIVALAAVSIPLAWLASTLATLADRLNDATGVELLPTKAAAFVFQPGTSWHTISLTVMHHQVFPAAVLALVFVPALVWWARQSSWFRTAGDSKPEAIMVVTSRLLPVLAVGVLVVELATEAQSLADALFRETWDGYAYAVATYVLLFGVLLSGTRWLVEQISVWGAPEPAPQSTQTARPERVGALWSRLRQDRRTRIGAAALLVIALLACYVQLWFAAGPNDVVSSGGATPPSFEHWFGIDALGRDALVRLSAGIGGSLFTAVVAATFAVLLGFGWLLVSARVPQTLGRPVLVLIDLLAIPAMVWIALPGGRELHRLGFAGQRLTLGLALGAIAVPLLARVLWRRCGYLLRSQNTPMRPAGVLAGLWFATVSGALLAEQLATFLLVQLDERSPTLGAVLARTVQELNTPLPGPDALTTWPWLWFPPAIATAALVAGFALLARAALKPAR